MNNTSNAIMKSPRESCEFWQLLPREFFPKKICSACSQWNLSWICGQVEAAHVVSENVSRNISLFHLFLLMLTTVAINWATFADH